MMAGWFGSSSQLDEQIDKATSSSLEDIALNFEISDIIRSKTVGSRDAMRSLKKRLDSKNPNTQLSTLNLTDTCVKNGGSHFLTEIASREYMDNLVSLLKAQGGAAVNQDVRTKILELIQTWATAVEGQEFSYIKETYDSLLREGFHFPPKIDVAKSMLVSNAPPEWVDSNVCTRCRAAFTFTNRKHHCRNCGNAFDHQCSSKILALPHLGITQPVRVDDGCYHKLTSKQNRGYTNTNDRSLTNRLSYQNPHQNSMQPRNARVDDIFDEDFKKALAMSLEEVNGHSGVGNEQSNLSLVTPRTNNSGKKLSLKTSDEEEEENLKVAIAASLADMEEQKKRHSARFKEEAQISENQPSRKITPPSNHHTLTPVDAENINLFSNLVDRLQNQSPGAVLREPQIQELYENICKLRPKLTRAYGETMSKHDSLLDLHAKLSTVVRYYDRLLEQRLSNTYNPLATGKSNIPQRPISNLYSTISPDVLNGNTENYYSSNFKGDQRLTLHVDDSHKISQYSNRSSVATVPITRSVRPEYNFTQLSQSEKPQEPYGSSQALLRPNVNSKVTGYYSTHQPLIPLSNNSRSSPSQVIEPSQLAVIQQVYPLQLAETSQPQNYIQLTPLQEHQNPSQQSSQQSSQQQAPTPNQQLSQQILHQQGPLQYQQSSQQLLQQQAPTPNQQASQQILHQQGPLQYQQSSQQSLQQQPPALNQQSSQQLSQNQLQQHIPQYRKETFWQQRSASATQEWSAQSNFDKHNSECYPSPPQHTLQQPMVEECLIEL